MNEVEKSLGFEQGYVALSGLDRSLSFIRSYALPHYVRDDKKREKVVPINKEVILAQSELPENFPDDPADRLIVSTALYHHFALATKDHVLQELGF